MTLCDSARPFGDQPGTDRRRGGIDTGKSGPKPGANALSSRARRLPANDLAELRTQMIILQSHPHSHPSSRVGRRRSAGMTLLELMIALAVGSFLVVGSLQIYGQSRQAYIINESIAGVQETAHFAMDTLEADLRMASSYGLLSRGHAIVGRSVGDNGNPQILAVPVNEVCSANWALNLARPVEGFNNRYGLGCEAKSGNPQAESDTLTIRRATTDPVAFDASRLQIHSTRLQGRIIDDGAMPAGFTAAHSQTHNLQVNSYYVDSTSSLMPGVPTLRRKTLGVLGGVPAVLDLEDDPTVAGTGHQRRTPDRRSQFGRVEGHGVLGVGRDSLMLPRSILK